MLYWAVLLGSCAVVTIIATLIAKRPMVSAMGVSLVAGIGTGLYGAGQSPLWMVGSVIVIVCSLPVTIASGMLTESLSEKWGSQSRERAP